MIIRKIIAFPFKLIAYILMITAIPFGILCNIIEKK